MFLFYEEKMPVSTIFTVVMINIAVTDNVFTVRATVDEFGDWIKAKAIALAAPTMIYIHE